LPEVYIIVVGFFDEPEEVEQMISNVKRVLKKLIKMRKRRA
jgi:hypothetical protein